MMELATNSLVFIAFLAFALKRLMTYMHALQQDDYDNERLFSWMLQHKAFDKRLSLAILGVSLAHVFLINSETFFITQFALFLITSTTAYVEADPRKQSKKKLVMTTRAKRIFFTACVPLLLLIAPSFLVSYTWQWVFVIQMIPLCLILGNLMLHPYESAVQQKFWNEAHNKVLQLQPKVIGITGSFGKTSVKHILGHILKMQAPTLITPGSVNTPMGITRIVREQLDERHQYFIVEMGAYGPGSIERLCRLTPPDMGIITALGHAHYERFKTLEAVAETKFELAQAVLNKGGKTVIHERTLRFDYTHEMKKNNIRNFIVCGVPADKLSKGAQDTSYLTSIDVHINGLAQTDKGLEIELEWKGEKYHLSAPIFGLHHAHNIALAFAAALDLGLDPDSIKAALTKLPQIEHRLEVKPMADGTTIVDDAFNSNPIGFRSALDLMPVLKKENGRAILITPGMVEMGKAHDEAHESIGRHAGQTCDIAIIVQPQRVPTLIKGFKETGNGKQVIEVESFDEASAWLRENQKPGDIILLENDLPDIYERVPKM